MAVNCFYYSYLVNKDLFTVEDFEKYHTRQLLNMKKAISFLRWQVFELAFGDITEEEFKTIETTWKSVLAKREHVPNKKESKALRIARKKKGV